MIFFKVYLFSIWKYRIHYYFLYWYQWIWSAENRWICNREKGLEKFLSFPIGMYRIVKKFKKFSAYQITIVILPEVFLKRTSINLSNRIVSFYLFNYFVQKFDQFRGLIKWNFCKPYLSPIKFVLSWKLFYIEEIHQIHYI